MFLLNTVLLCIIFCIIQTISSPSSTHHFPSFNPFIQPIHSTHSFTLINPHEPLVHRHFPSLQTLTSTIHRAPMATDPPPRLPRGFPVSPRAPAPTDCKTCCASARASGCRPEAEAAPRLGRSFGHGSPGGSPSLGSPLRGKIWRMLVVEDG